MNILYDNIIYSLQRAGGISNYWMELTSRAIAAGNQVRMLEFADAEQNIFRRKIAFNKTQLQDQGNILPAQRYMPVKLPVAKEATIFHSSYYRVPYHRKGHQVVTTLHDFIYEYHVGGIRKKVHSYQKKLALLNANGIICISENTKNDLLKFYPECAKKPVVVIYNGISNDFHPLQGIQRKVLSEILNVPEVPPYALFIGDRAAYKNFDYAMQVVAQDKHLSLIIVGGRALSKEETAKLTATLGQRYFHLSGIDTPTLNQLYNFAEYLLYPSSYEGFGMPLIEAMRAGCPVIALNRSSISELADGYELLLNNINLQEAAEKIIRIKNNRQTIVHHGFNLSEKYSWEQCAKETMQFYATMLSGNLKI